MFTRIALLLFTQLFVLYGAFSQTLMVEKAYRHLRSGELTQGLEAINLASQNEYTANDPKTWYLKAFLCKELYKNQPEVYYDFRQQALEAVQKCVELDTNHNFTQDCEAITVYLQTSYLNEAVQSLNAGDFEKALSTLQQLGQDRDQAYYAEVMYYSGYAALMLERKEEARQFFENALAAGYQDPLAYEALSNYYLEKQNLDLAVALLREGKKFFPDSRELKIAELNLLMSQQNYEETEKQVEIYLQDYPDDIEVMLMAGTVYDKLFQNDTTRSSLYFQKRKDIYQKVLAKDPNDLMGNYNLGITLYNQAVKMINQQANEYEVDIIEFNRLLGECTALFKEALPYIQQANQLMPDNINTLKAMQGIYYNLNDREKFNQIQARLEALNRK